MKSNSILLRGEHLEDRRLLAATPVDIDLDGDIDLVTAAGWYENYDGWGSLRQHSFNGARNALRQIGDIDGDGDLDIAFPHGWLENENGKGEFAELKQYNVADIPTEKMRLLDLDGDGDLDVLLIAHDRVVTLQNDGMARFELVAEIVVPGIVDAVDYNGDGVTDAIANVKAEDGYHDIFLHQSSGDGYSTEKIDGDIRPIDFGEFVTFPTYVAALGFFRFGEEYRIGKSSWRDGGLRLSFGGAETNCFACEYYFVDFDFDGDQDVVMEFVVYENVGNDLVARGHAWAGGNALVADMNGDGILDQFADRRRETSWTDGVTGIVHEDGQKPTPLPASEHAFVAIKSGQLTDNRYSHTQPLLANIDDDDELEIVYQNVRSVDAFDLIDGQLHEAKSLYFVGENDYRIDSIELNDVDGDNDTDLMVKTNDVYVILVNDGAGSFTKSTELIFGRFQRPRTVHSAQIDDDKMADLIFVHRGPGVFGGSVIEIRTAKSEFTAQSLASTHTVLSSAVVDADRDGDIDLVTVVGYFTGRRDRAYELWWYENVGNSLTQGKRIEHLGDRNVTLYTTDMDGNGHPDLVLQHYRGVVWKSDILDEAMYELPLRDVELGDIDNDGDADLVSRGPLLKWYENLGGNQFADERRIGITPLATSTAALGDFDSDGDVDAMVVNGGRATLYQHRLTGDVNNDGVFDSSDLVQVFQSGQYEDGGYRNSTFETGDWNGDREFDSSDLVFAYSAGTYAGTARR